MFFYKLAKAIARGFIALFYPTKFYGKENMPPKSQNCIGICNHLGKIDVVLCALPFKHKVYFLSKKELSQKKFFGGFLRSLGAIPVDREHVDINATKAVLKRIKEGKDIMIFPEGTRNRRFDEVKLLPLKDGAGVFAFKTQTQVVPMAIHHPGRIFRKNYVYIGKPFTFEEFYGMKYTNEMGQQMNEKMREEMLKCMDALDEIVKSKKRGGKKK